MVKYILKKHIKKILKTTTYDLDGFNQDGDDRKGFDRNGFIINEIDENGFNGNKELACEEKVKQAIRENPWNIYYASEEFRNKYEITKECVESDRNTYQYVTLHLKNKNVDLALFFIERAGSFSLISKHLSNNKKLGLIAVKNNPKKFQYVGINLRNDDDIFELAVQ